MDKIQVLDHGYVQLIESWGSDERIIEAARMSTDKGFQGWGSLDCFCIRTLHCDEYHQHKIECCTPNPPKSGCNNCAGTGKTKPGDEKLLAYLYNHKHMTPFEMAGMIIEVQAPIFVFREWHRHRTQSYNELSARYTELPDLFYLPSIERLQNSKQGQKNKQGSEEGFTKEFASDFQDFMQESYQESRSNYKTMLEAGISREIARLVIPVAQYSRMRASANLRNWLQFLTLRMDVNAQYEIRMYANTVGELIMKTFPRTWDLFQLPNGR